MSPVIARSSSGLGQLRLVLAQRTGREAGAGNLSLLAVALVLREEQDGGASKLRS